MKILRLAGFGLVLLLSLLIALYAFAAYSLRPVGAMVDAALRATFEAHRTGIYLHVFASAVALALGPFQFCARLRPGASRGSPLDGPGLPGGVLIGGLAGLYMAFYAYGGLAGRLGFGALGAGVAVYRIPRLPRHPCRRRRSTTGAG